MNPNPNRTAIGLDRRLIAAGLAVTVPVLVAVFADHWPGIPAASTCPECGFAYPDNGGDCPTNQVVRPLLYRRRAENKHAFSVLSDDQLADLHHGKPIRTKRMAVRQAAQPASRPARTQSLLDLLGEDVTP